MDCLALKPIATVNSPYKEKFAIPRQPGLVAEAVGEIVFNDALDAENMIKGIEQYSHLWVIFAFHGTMEQGWKPLVKAPRLGGNKKIGVLATRSTFRPNPIGMSVVQLKKVSSDKGKVTLHIGAHDLLDKTPIIDIKPYIPYADSIPQANGGIAQEAPELVEVIFTEQATKQLNAFKSRHRNLAAFIEQVLAQDPRPAYKKAKTDDKVYGMQLYDLNILWSMKSLTTIQVTQVEEVK